MSAVVAVMMQPSRLHGEQLIGPLVPDALRASARPHPAPLPALPARTFPPALADAPDLLLATALPSRCGRVYVQPLLRALGWGPGHRLDIQPHQGMLVISSADDERHQIGSREELPLPASARRMCGIEAGRPVLLAAVVTRDLLVVHPASTVVRLLADLHAKLTGGGHVR